MRSNATTQQYKLYKCSILQSDCIGMHHIVQKCVTVQLLVLHVVLWSKKSCYVNLMSKIND